MKTKQQIEKMVELLGLQRDGIPHYSHFGDDNYESIDGQAHILKMALLKGEGWVEDYRDGPCSDDALRACDWVLGESDEPLVEGDDVWVQKARRKA